MSPLYGVGAALTLDEFALWLSEDLDPSPTSINQQNPTASKEECPDEVVDMLAANVNVMKRRDVAVSAVSHGTRHRKRDEKFDGPQRKSRRFGRSRTCE
jgi:hypothetical protein